MSETARWATVNTPDGPFTLIADDNDRILASGWVDDPDYLAALIHSRIQPETVRHAPLAELTGAVEAYYAGDHDIVTKIPVRQHSGDFLLHAWDVLRAVDAGEVVTYSEFAERAGNAPAIRAAASACARNAAALFVPCHRVIGKSGKLTGFRYGVDIKRSLLEREAA
ncbi:methylated-DNA--protein-cysteine methyltransferase [Gordonia effusa NBRC 100432]|uniref:Methylated-DNA--protein-cysteine methyltransferase n=1 Tax=Gordonia effusa NBRC 100432 TaxID=1077974 RepID=H0QVB9_9ACTN|nr:methylated-DNA--[protein]-cysteine S-methyltransferase [Gordonia effusa]GAB16770.1 methylated-DNA--protein-cysteine methyltransferase [Gordonia effusa NBRC 100432]